MALARIPVGVVVERPQSVESQWIDVAWRPVGGAGRARRRPRPGHVLESSDDRHDFYAGLAEVALYRTETAHYRDNLNSGAPSLWVSLRPTGVEPPFEIVGRDG